MTQFVLCFVNSLAFLSIWLFGIELSIVFNTPDIIDRKYPAGRNSIKCNSGKKKGNKMHEPFFIRENSKRNSIVYDESSNNVEEEHNCIFTDANNSSVSSIHNGALYSRVVAPPTSRSSSSSSSSESATSFDSAGMLSASEYLKLLLGMINQPFGNVDEIFTFQKLWIIVLATVCFGNRGITTCYARTALCHRIAIFSISRCSTKRR